MKAPEADPSGLLPVLRDVVKGLGPYPPLLFGFGIAILAVIVYLTQVGGAQRAAVVFGVLIMILALSFATWAYIERKKPGQPSTPVEFHQAPQSVVGEATVGKLDAPAGAIDATQPRATVSIGRGAKADKLDVGNTKLH